MNTALANQLLRALLEWDEQTEEEYVNTLMSMASWKWDAYEGFRAGQRFLESLARWLAQFDDPTTRFRWIKFVVDRMIFISSSEMDHLISVAYPDIIRPAVLARVAAQSGIAPHLKRRVIGTSEFRAEQRRALVLGLSDGARLDILRRNSEGLSHEQFVPSSEVPVFRRKDLSDKLAAALETFGSDAEATFNHVLLVDDFYGSGTSLMRLEIGVDGQPNVQGKVRKFIEQANELTTAGGHDQPALLSEDYRVTILLYVASERAKDHIQAALQDAGLGERWSIDVIQIIDNKYTVIDDLLLSDCDKFWDPILEDEHKKRAARGYRDCALPVVLYHNAPNNSVSPLWADSTGRTRDGAVGLNRRALFPRYERHHSDRP
jgi:hypothetical protein